MSGHASLQKPPLQRPESSHGCPKADKESQDCFAANSRAGAAAPACRRSESFHLELGARRVEPAIQAAEKPTALGLKKQLGAIKGQQVPWVYDSPRDANAQPFANLGKAFARFFNKEARRPRFKKKGKSRDAFYVASDKFRVDGKAITLPRIGKVRMCEALCFQGTVTGATVSRAADRWFVAISVEVELPVARCENQARTEGVDLGVSRLATLSDVTSWKARSLCKEISGRLARLNRRLHRKVAGSRNRAKAAMRVARCQGRVVSMRGDALHKLTTGLVRAYGRIVIEDLNVKGMVRSRRLARAISDMGFGEFGGQLFTRWCRRSRSWWWLIAGSRQASCV